MNFIKTLKAKMTEDKVSGLWGISRGSPYPYSRRRPHLAALVTASVGEGEVRRVIVHDVFASDPDELDFRTFLRLLRAEHQLHSAALTCPDAATMMELRNAGIRPVLPHPVAYDVELVVPASATRDRVDLCMDVIKAAGASALLSHDGVDWA